MQCSVKRVVENGFAPAGAIVNRGKNWMRLGSSTTMVILGSLLLITSMSMASCSSKKTRLDAEKKQQPLTLGVSKSMMATPVYIAYEKGLFAREGLDVTLKEFGSGKLATRAMLSGQIDVSTVADLPIVFNAFDGADFCVLATFTASYRFAQIVVRSDRGIQNAADLKNKKIGANRGTTSHFYLGAFLTDNGLSMTDVEMRNYGTPELAEALIRGDVDAISVWAPHEQKALNQLKTKAVLLKGGEIYRTTFSLAANKGFSKKRRDVATRLIRALNAAARFCTDHREEAETIIATTFSLRRSVVSAYWDEYRFGTFLDQAFLTGLDDVARWAIENKFVTQSEIPNFFNYVCPEVLASVYPDDVSIVR